MAKKQKYYVLEREVGMGGDLDGSHSYPSITAAKTDVEKNWEILDETSFSIISFLPTGDVVTHATGRAPAQIAVIWDRN